MKLAYFFLILFSFLLAARMCHVGILWAEEDLPLAAAAQMQAGKTLYRDIWFDKPPLLAAAYVPLRTRPGWPLRLAGALYGLVACALAYRFAGAAWGANEARWAASLMAFFLIFDTPSAVTPLAADLLMLTPHMAAVYLSWRRRPFWAGAAAGIAFCINSKGLLVLAACALWSWRSLPALAAGFAIPNLAAVAWMWRDGGLAACYEQVWKWGRVYAARTFVEHPLHNAVVRTGGWLGFHSALAIGGMWFWLKDRGDRWRWAAWLALSCVAVAAGWRFFPRYFFQVLPAMVLAGARGISLLPARVRVGLIGVALLVPAVRFGPRYVSLAARGDADWVDTAMDRDSRDVGALLRGLEPGPLFVWGFRPEIYLYSGFPAACRFLDSQPVTGVPADRHLVDSTSVTPELAAANRLELIRSRPAVIVDGLGVYNPALAIAAFPDLRGWMADYQVAGRTRESIVYRRVRP